MGGKRTAITRNDGPIDDLELKAIVDHEIKSAMGEIGGELADERSEAMDYYVGEPVGPLSQPNSERSSVVMTTVRDTVEWIMPQVMRTLAQADTVVQFDSVGYEDEQAAKQETHAINHLFWRKNEGFLILYQWIKDALIQKNGVVKYWIEEVDERTREEYDGLTDKVLAQMLQDDELEPKEYEVSDEKGINGETLYHVVFERNIKEKRIRVDVIPPEEFLISSDARSVDLQTQPPRFCGHRTEKYCTELRAMGFSEDDIEAMKRGDERWDELDEEWQSRYYLSDEQEHVFSKASHESLIPITIVEGYMNLDMDGDGYAELVKVWRAGDFVETEECDSRPFAALTPIIMSHKFTGLSIDDLVSELQDIHTAVMRNTLDNMYQVNNARPVVNERVDTDSLLTSRPGAPIYVDDEGPVGDAVAPYAPPPMWKEGMVMLEYIDGVRKDRTGVGDETMGLDPQQMATANTGVVLSAIEAARGKIELIARIFAETGIKWLFRGLHELCRKSYDQKLRYELNRQYVEVDPREWRRRSDMTVNVGTATGSLQQDLFAFERMFQIQEKMVAGGMLGKTILPQNIYALAKDYAEVLKQYGEKYFFNPMLLAQPQVQKLVQMQLPQQPDAQMEAVKAMAQSERMKAEVAAKKAMMEADLKKKELDLKLRELAAKAELEDIKNQITAAKEAAKYESDTEKVRLDAQLTAREQDLKAEIAQLQANIDNLTNARDNEADLRMKQAELLVEQQNMAMQAAQFATQQQQAAEQQTGEVSKSLEGVTKALDAVAKLQEQVKELAKAQKEMSDKVGKPRTVEYDTEGKVIKIG